MSDDPKQHKIMTKADFRLAMFETEARYDTLAGFYHSDRRTGHRWQQDGPPNPVARFLELLLVLDLSLDDAAVLIAAGRDASGGGPLPVKIVSTDLKGEVARIRGKKDRTRGRTSDRSKSRPHRASDEEATAV